MSENNKGSKTTMKQKIPEIQRDIEIYQQAIENAEGALEEAERELNDFLADTCEPADGLLP